MSAQLRAEHPDIKQSYHIRRIGEMWRVMSPEVCDAVCCSVLQRVAACCSVLQRVAECCKRVASVLQVCCSVLQCDAVCVAV